MITDQVGSVARRAAARLADRYGAAILVDVEDALHARSAAGRPQQYGDWIDLASLVVTVTGVALAAHETIRRNGGKGRSAELATALRTELGGTDGPDRDDRELIIRVIVEVIHTELGPELEDDEER
jgi:pimeloyl-ACP methyl ester carboxylesterase